MARKKWQPEVIWYDDTAAAAVWDVEPIEVACRTIGLVCADAPGFLFEVTLRADRSLHSFVIRTGETTRWCDNDSISRAAPSQTRPILTARLLREVPLGAFVEAACDAAEGQSPELRWYGDPDRDEYLSRNTSITAQEWNKEFEAQPRPGRRGRNDLYYARVAEMYVAALPGGQPVKKMMDWTGQSHETLSHGVHVARLRGLLTEAQRGRAGGSLTQRAIELLEEDTDGAR